MASKGIDYYTFLGSNSFRIDFTKPISHGNSRQTITKTAADAMLTGNYQLSQIDIGLTELTGRFQWTAYQNDSSIATRYAEIAPITGNLGSSTMGVMLNTPSLFTPDYALSYGFYDAGPGLGGLTNQDQSYVYVTPPVSRWMGDLLAANPALGNAPFHVFALPGVHDAGTFSTAMYAVMEQSNSFINALNNWIGATLSPSAVNRAIANMAVTQKDNTVNQLNLGARYIDFRPGYTYDNIAAGIYHEHNFIPGYDYPSFLCDVLAWLSGNPSEIVVVSLNFQGFAQDTMKPSVANLNQGIAAAVQQTGTQNIQMGDASALDQTVADLLASNTRLIFLNQIGSATDADKYDSYTDAYTTTDVSVILNALSVMQSTPQNGAAYTVLQLQGTANGTGGGIFKAIATSSDASSPLMSTKALFDNQTYPWLQANVASQFSPEYLVVLLNDFVDNALACYAKDITLQRLGKL
jgi:hypothetical protein